MESPNVAKLVNKLDQDPALNSKDLYKVLVTIRTKHMNQEAILLQEGAIGKLVNHLKRPNSKIVDVVLSILGNLLLNEEARKQIKPHLRILTSILTTLNEENILARLLYDFSFSTQLYSFLGLCTTREYCHFVIFSLTLTLARPCKGCYKCQPQDLRLNP